ncbi:hypothetical protein PDJ95_29295 [Bacillus cereus]|nr:hypothetical protein [Bacillus cereus]
MKKSKDCKCNQNPGNTPNNAIIDNSFFNNFLVIKNIQTSQVLASNKEIDPTLDPNFNMISGSTIQLEPEADTENQKYIIYPLDPGNYLLVHKQGFSNSNGLLLIGNFLQSQGVLDDYYQLVTSKNIDNYSNDSGYLSPNAKWTILKVNNTDNIFQIKDTQYGYYLVPGFYPDVKHSDDLFGVNTLGYEKFKTTNSNQQWEFKKINPLPFNIFPSTPSRTEIGPVPQYDNDPTKNLPVETEKVLIGVTKIPAVMVKADNISTSKKLDLHPYYILERYDYWKRLENSSLAPGESLETISIYGTTSTIQNSIAKDIDMVMDKKFGLKFNVNASTPGGNYNLGVTGDLEQTITKDLKTRKSTTTSELDSCTEIHKRGNNTNTTFLYTNYIIATDFVLKRPSQSEYDPDIIVNTWTFTNPTTKVDTHISY